MTGNILPLGQTQFFDDNGDPLGLGKVFFYIPFTFTLKDTWQDGNQDTLNTNPVELDAAGRANIWGTGMYRQIVTDANDVQIWDKLITSGAASGTEYIIAAASDDLDDARVATSAFGVEWDFDTPAEASLKVTQAIMIVVGDETTPITTGVGKVHWRMPYAFTVVEARINVVTAQATGPILRVDLLQSGVSILSASLAIDNTEKTSVTASIQPSITAPDLADDAEMSVDVIQVSGATTAAGLKVTLVGYHA